MVVAMTDDLDTVTETYGCALCGQTYHNRGQALACCTPAGGEAC